MSFDVLSDVLGRGAISLQFFGRDEKEKAIQPQLDGFSRFQPVARIYFFLRRAATAKPASPTPTSISVVGSGVVVKRMLSMPVPTSPCLNISDAERMGAEGKAMDNV
jgi:hypothetical protein